MISSQMSRSRIINRVIHSRKCMLVHRIACNFFGDFNNKAALMERNGVFVR